jgi:hypothetical protein
MIHASRKVAFAVALGSFAWIGLAQAAAPLPLNSNATLVILAADEENEEVWRDLRPDVTPPEGAVGKREEEAPKGGMEEAPMGEGSGDVETQELWRDLETGVTPPPGE